MQDGCVKSDRYTVVNSNLQLQMYGEAIAHKSLKAPVDAINKLYINIDTNIEEAGFMS